MIAPVGEHVGDAARDAHVVLEHHPAAVRAAHEVAADDVHVQVVGHLDADHLAPEVAGEHHEPARHDAVPQDLLGVVDVVHEAVERADPLLQARLDDGPLLGRDDPRDGVEGQDPLRTLAVVVVDGEGDAAVQERARRELGGAAQLARVHDRELGRQPRVVRARERRRRRPRPGTSRRRTRRCRTRRAARWQGRPARVPVLDTLRLYPSGGSGHTGAVRSAVGQQRLQARQVPRAQGGQAGVLDLVDEGGRPALDQPVVEGAGRAALELGVDLEVGGTGERLRLRPPPARAPG